jgi:HSP20 family protein
VATRAPRVWVFAKEPTFARFQGKLRVQRLNEPTIDVFDQADQVTLIAQLPGASMEGVDLHIEGDLIIIEAIGVLSIGQVKYYREVLLPFEVEAVPQKVTLNNGILEIDLRRKGRP